MSVWFWLFCLLLGSWIELVCRIVRLRRQVRRSLTIAEGLVSVIDRLHERTSSDEAEDLR